MRLIESNMPLSARYQTIRRQTKFKILKNKAGIAVTP
jgi:hypothetical protein